MLKTLLPRLACPTCLVGGQLQAHVFVEGTQDHIQDGVLVCQGCGAWYPIDDNLLELVKSPLVDADGMAAFCRRWRNELRTLRLDSLTQTRGAGEYTEQLKQREHFDWYAENGRQSYLDYAKTPFWTAVDEVTFGRWRSRIRAGTWLLDIGCANGRSAFPMADFGITVIGCDISKKMVRQAIEQAKQRGRHGTTTFLVADGSDLPFAQRSFDYALTYGVLHHLPDPGKTCRAIQQILTPGATFFASENNKTIFRGIFDALMKLLPLWTEEAGSEPLISRTMIRAWHDGLRVRINSATSVFVPPHLMNIVGRKAARLLLTLTDKIASWIPGARAQGGLIVFEVHKSADSSGEHHESVSHVQRDAARAAAA